MAVFDECLRAVLYSHTTAVRPKQQSYSSLRRSLSRLSSVRASGLRVGGSQRLNRFLFM